MLDGHWLRIGLAWPVFRRFRCVFIAFLDFRMQAGVVACRIHDDCIGPNARSTLHGRSGSARADGVLATCFRPTSACRHSARGGAIRSILTRAGSLRCVRRPCPGAGVVSAMRLAGCVCSRAALGPFWRCHVHRSRPQRKRSADALLLRCGEPLALPRRVGCRRLARPRDYSASRDWLLSVCW